jgi:hypothetical protein
VTTGNGRRYLKVVLESMAKRKKKTKRDKKDKQRRSREDAAAVFVGIHWNPRVAAAELEDIGRSLEGLLEEVQRLRRDISSLSDADGRDRPARVAL